VHDIQLLDAVVCAAMRVAEAPPAAAAQPAAESKDGESKDGEAAAAAPPPADERAEAAIKMQSMSRGFLARKRVEKVSAGQLDTAAAIAKPPSRSELEMERAKAAARIQAVARGKADRAHVGRVGLEKDSAEKRLAALTASDDAAAQASAAGGDAKASRAAADSAAESSHLTAAGHDVYEEAAHGSSGASSQPEAADWSGKAAFVKDLAGVRIGVPRARYFDGLDESTSAVVEEALRRLAKAGAVLVECDFAKGATRDNDRHPIDLAVDVVAPVQAFEAPRELASYLYTHVAAPEEKKKPAEGEEEEAPPEESPEEAAAKAAAGPPPPRPLDTVLSVTSILQGFKGPAAEKSALTAQLARATAASSTTYRSAIVYRRPALKRVFATLIKQHSLACIVYPCTPLPSAAPRGADGSQVELNGELVDATATYTRNTMPASAAGLPALCIPCGMTRPKNGAPKGSPGAERLPVALEFVADSNDDERLLSLGRAVQRLQSPISDPLLMRAWSSGVTFPHQ